MDLQAIPTQLLIAFGAGLCATLGAHLGIVRMLRPPGAWHLDQPLVGIALYAAGAVLCALITYGAWCELSPPASIAVSAAWGLSHPLATSVALWALQKRAPDLARRVKRERGQ